MSMIKARRNALADMESENVRQQHKGSIKTDTSESNTKPHNESGGAFYNIRSGAEGGNEHPTSTYTSSELSEEIVVTTDDESSITSHKEHKSKSGENITATDYTRSFNAANNSDCCVALPLPMTRRENELNNNGLSNCNLLVNIPERDIRATIEQWREMATLAAISYGSNGVDPEKLLMSVPSTLSLHQPPSSFMRYDKNRIL